jgi:hypothetical protein
MRTLKRASSLDIARNIAKRQRLVFGRDKIRRIKDVCVRQYRFQEIRRERLGVKTHVEGDDVKSDGKRAGRCDLQLQGNRIWIWMESREA